MSIKMDAEQEEVVVGVGLAVVRIAVEAMVALPVDEDDRRPALIVRRERNCRTINRG